MTYRDPVSTLLIGILNQYGPSELRNRYYYGDPLVVAESALPAVFISKDDTEIANSDVATDEHRMNYVINVVYDLKRDFGKRFDDTRAANSLYDFIEGREDDLTLKTTAVTSVLRSHYQLAAHCYVDLDTPLKVNYGVTGESRGANIFTAEGIVRCQVYLLQSQPSA